MYHKKCTDLRLTKSKSISPPTHSLPNSVVPVLTTGPKSCFYLTWNFNPPIALSSMVSGEVGSVTICVQLRPMEAQSILRLQHDIEK